MCYSLRQIQAAWSGYAEGLSMTVGNLKWLVPVAAFAMVVTAARAEVIDGTKIANGMTVQYKVVLPNGYDPAKAYPAIVALGGGPQTMNTVQNILNRNFQAEAESRGYIVIAP